MGRIKMTSEEHEIVLFVKAGSDRESKPKELSDIAPGTQTPFVMYDGEVITDNLEIEEFLESRLHPPSYPSLAAQNPESLLAGNDIFSKFSAWIKCSPDHPNFKALQERFSNSLMKFNDFLQTKLGDQSERLFIDGNKMTLPDCGLLPKLHI